MEVISFDRPDIIKVRDLTEKVSSVHTFMQPFRQSTEMTEEEIEVLSAIELDEYYVDKIVAHKKKIGTQRMGSSK